MFIEYGTNVLTYISRNFVADDLVICNLIRLGNVREDISFQLGEQLMRRSVWCN